MNGGSLYWPDTCIQYVEGYSLNLFAAGEVFLKPVRQQKVGLLLDAGLESDLKKDIYKLLMAVSQVWG